MMSEKEARAFITQVAPLGTMDYSLLHKRPPMIKTNYGFSWPVPPATLVIGIVVIILLIAADKDWNYLLYAPPVHISLFLLQHQNSQQGIWGLSPLALTGADTPLSPVAHHSPTNKRYRLCMLI